MERGVSVLLETGTRGRVTATSEVFSLREVGG